MHSFLKLATGVVGVAVTLGVATAQLSYVLVLFRGRARKALTVYTVSLRNAQGLSQDC